MLCRAFNVALESEFGTLAGVRSLKHTRHYAIVDAVGAFRQAGAIEVLVLAHPLLNGQMAIKIARGIDRNPTFIITMDVATDSAYLSLPA